MKIELSKRIEQLPPYLFAELDRLKAEQVAKGIDVIDLGIGDPDQPTPGPIIEALCKAAKDPKHHKYPPYNGTKEFRHSVAHWMKRRFGVILDADTEVMALLGSKEGIANFPLAFLNPGDVAIITSPLYPPAFSGPLFAGAIHHILPLTNDRKFLPDLKSIPKDIAERAKTFYLNYPNNPTGALAPKSFFEEVVAFAKQHNIILIHDMAYSEIYYDTTPVSILEVKGAKDVAIEFHSFSKTFNMTGWRLGFAVGNEALIAGLQKIKTNIDSGTFEAIQIAGIEALTHYETLTTPIRKVYAERRKIFIDGLKDLGFEVAASQATFYVWVAVPEKTPSKDYAKKLLEQAGIVATPGIGFGKAGEGYIRFALTKDVERLKEALARIKEVAAP